MKTRSGKKIGSEVSLCECGEAYGNPEFAHLCSRCFHKKYPFIAAKKIKGNYNPFWREQWVTMFWYHAKPLPTAFLSQLKISLMHDHGYQVLMILEYCRKYNLHLTTEQVEIINADFPLQSRHLSLILTYVIDRFNIKKDFVPACDDEFVCHYNARLEDYNVISITKPELVMRNVSFEEEIRDKQMAIRMELNSN